MKKTILIITTIFLLTISAVNATQISIAITGSVSEIHDPLGHLSDLDSTINVGDSVSGIYVYDSDTIPITNVPVDGYHYYYSESPYGMNLEIENTQFDFNAESVGFNINVVDDYQASFETLHDVIRMGSYSSSTTPEIGSFSWQLIDYSHQVLTNMDLPLTAPVLENWDVSELLISEDYNLAPYNNYLITSQITSAVVVPEPVTILLFGLGGIILNRASA